MDRVYYDDLVHIPKPGKNLYNAETYLGNWYEETVRNTLKRKEFLMKRECGDLTIQRTQTMVDLLLKPVELSVHVDSYLHFGDQVQIVSPGPSCKLAMDVYPFKRNYCKLAHLALSAAVPPTAIDNAPYLNTDSIISASTLLYPVVRNSFIIENPDCPSDTSGTVNYGDPFRIRAFQTQYFPLYLFSAPGIRLHAASIHSAKPKVRFSDLKISDTLWCAHPLDLYDKMKMELGVPIPLKTRLLIKHNGSGRNLSIESTFPVLTYFGNELEVTVDSKFDRVRCPTFENLWYFDTDRCYPHTKDGLDKEFKEQARLSAKINANTVTRSAAETAKEEEAAKKEAEGADDDEEDQYDYQVEKQPLDFEVTREIISPMTSMTTPVPDGQSPYDPMTGPQPNAYSYRITDNDPFFPNKKWNCGDTDCCNPLRPGPPPPPPCEPCICLEPVPPGESPNAYVPFKRLIM